MGHVHDVLALGRRGEHVERDESRVQGVLEVVHGVGHVVGPIHDLLFQAGALARSALAQPMKDFRVVGVVAELVRLPTQVGAATVIDGRGVTPRPGVFARGIEGGPRKVEADAATGGRVDDLRLQPSHDPQGLRIALEATDRLGQPIEFTLAVVTEGRVPQVVRESRDVDEIRVATERRPHLSGDLRDLEGVGQARAWEVGAAGDENLRCRCEPPQAR